MDDTNAPGQPPKPPGESPDPGGDFIRGQVQHKQISARVPESVARGVFSTGAIVLVGANEFIMDFVIRMAQPHQVAARVVVPHAVMPQLIAALRANLDRYRQRFGDPPEMPRGEPGARRPSIEEVYDELKFPDENLSGAYANAVMISHSPAEFVFDFITNFFPKSSVSARVYVSAAQVPRLLEALGHTFAEFQKRVAAQQQQQLRQQQQQQQFINPQITDRIEPSPYYPPKNLGSEGPQGQIVSPPDAGATDPPNEQIVGPADLKPLEEDGPDTQHQPEHPADPDDQPPRGQ